MLMTLRDKDNKLIGNMCFSPISTYVALKFLATITSTGPFHTKKYLQGHIIMNKALM